jgi:hypothetical protein
MTWSYDYYGNFRLLPRNVILLTAAATFVVFYALIQTADAFLLHRHSVFQYRHHNDYFQPLNSESSSSENGGDESPLDAMRRMLEASWDAETMGRVPLDSASGAMECVQAIMSAAMRKDGETGVFFVDLHLPAYDISQGERLYDEVMATEFCIELSNGLEGKSEILVRDQKTLDTVQKILSVREESAAFLGYDDDDDDDYLGEDDDSEQDDTTADATLPDSDDDEEEEIALNEDVDSFRQKLMSGWDIADGETIGTGWQQNPLKASSESEPMKKGEAPCSNNKTYRLASMFGNARIGSGGDMPQDVVRAVRDNALACEDEQNIIILSPAGQDEMVGVRALVEKYESEKKIILVNCQFTQMPRELQSADTVYSILPLIAKEKRTGKDLVVDGDDGSSSKVVVMRRFPKDWEIFVDIGNGFELAETVPVTPTNRRGIPMEKVTDSLTRYLKSI